MWFDFISELKILNTWSDVGILSLLLTLGNWEFTCLICSDTSTLAHDLWGMTCDLNVYVSMFWVTLEDLLVGYIGIIKKKNGNDHWEDFHWVTGPLASKHWAFTSKGEEIWFG